MIIAYCSEINCGAVRYINSKPHSDAGVFDISNSAEEWRPRKPLVNLLYSSILIAKLFELTI